MDWVFVFCIAVDHDRSGHFTEQSSDRLKIRQETANGNRVEERGKRDSVRQGMAENTGSITQLNGQYAGSLNRCGVCGKRMDEGKR